MKKATRAQAAVLYALRQGARLDTWNVLGMCAYLLRARGKQETVRMPTFFRLLENGWIEERAREGQRTTYLATHVGYDALDTYMNTEGWPA